MNRKNEILDKDLCKMVDHGLLDVHNKFRLKKQKQRKNNHQQFSSIQSRSSLNKTVGKHEFDKFLEINSQFTRLV